jgi:hypothetical protein
MKGIFIFCTLAVLLSCEDNNDAALRNNPIDSKIVIETVELLGIDSRSLTLRCETEKIYPCINFRILTEEKVSSSPFKITFTEVEEELLCLTAIGPATTVVDLSEIANGEYPIELNNGNLKNKGILKVSDTEIKLILNTQRGIKIVKSATRRVPHNTYWGTIGYHEADSKTLVDAFLQKFIDKGATFSKQVPGHYFYYEIDKNGTIVQATDGYYFGKTFIFQYDGDITELKDLIRIDGKNYSDHFLIRLETFKGEHVDNWSKD